MTPDGARCRGRPCGAGVTGEAGFGILVAMRDPLVAADLAEALAQGLPGAEVQSARSCDEALALLGDDCCAPALAFVAAAPEGFADSALGRRLAVLGCRIVLMGDAAEERGEAAGFTVLHRPFTDEQLLAIVQAVLPRG